MALVKKAIPNLYGGVSQQPQLARYPNQLERQVNALSDPVEGLKKRPPTEFVAKLMDNPATSASVFAIDRDPDNRFVGVAADGQVRVFDSVTGDEQTVTGGTSPYLNSDSPRSDLQAITVADYTFIVNRSVTVGKKADVVPDRPYEALVFIRAGNYARTYKVYIDDVMRASYKTPTGSDPDQGPNIDTANIAQTLVTGTATVNSDYDEAIGSLQSVPGLTVEHIGSLIYITSASDFTIRVEDGQGGEAMRAIKGSVQSFTDLPRGGKEGFKVKIRGSQGSTDDEYYVEYEGDEVWKESIAAGVETSLDPETLPHALVRQSDGTFTFEPLPWVDRAVGDDKSNPFPSITDHKITGIFYYRDRLGFLADEQAVMSRSGDYFNLFRMTVTQLLADDRVDITIGDSSGESSPVSKLQHAVAFDKKLVLFARNVQFVVDSGNERFGPGTVKTDPVTNFQASALCRPVSAGRYVYFPFDRDGASGIRELSVDNVTRTEDAPEITSHCPTYLPSGIAKMTGSTLENVLLAFSVDTPRRVYVYRYFNGNDGSKAQSAWSYWEFAEDDTVLSIDFFDNVANVVVSRPDGIYLEKIRFRPNLTDPDLDFFTHLDRRISGEQVVLTYHAPTDTTRIQLPYEATGSEQVYTLFSTAGDHAPGQQVPIVAHSSYELAVSGDKTGWNLVVGVPYEMLFELTPPFLIGRDGVADTRAVVKVRDYELDYQGSGYFEAVFQPRFRSPRSKTFSGRLLGSTALNAAPMEDGTFRIKTPTRNDHWSLVITNNSPFPSAFLAASWRALVTAKGRSV